MEKFNKRRFRYENNLKNVLICVLRTLRCILKYARLTFERLLYFSQFDGQRYRVIIAIYSYTYFLLKTKRQV